MKRLVKNFAGVFIEILVMGVDKGRDKTMDVFFAVFALPLPLARLVGEEICVPVLRKQPFLLFEGHILHRKSLGILFLYRFDVGGVGGRRGVRSATLGVALIATVSFIPRPSGGRASRRISRVFAACAFSGHSIGGLWLSWEGECAWQREATPKCQQAQTRLANLRIPDLSRNLRHIRLRLILP